MSAETSPHFSEREMQMLTAVCDTLVPPVEVSPDPDGLFARKASDIGVPAEVAETLNTMTLPARQWLVRLTLDLLDVPLLNYFSGGRFKSFLEMTLDERTALLRTWAESDLPALRFAFQGFKRLALFYFYTVVDDHKCNPNWPAIGYPGPLTVPPADNPIKPLALTDDTTLYTDVVIVGSGAGGGVVAGELAAAGLDVIVLEKGGYYPEANFDRLELSSARHLFEHQGFLTTDDLGIVVLAGSNLGGGTTINWCASLRTPDNVLDEWEQVYGVKTFIGPDYQKALDAISARLNVNVNESAPNAQNAVLQRGGEALGYEVKTMPRNVKNCGDCGFCNYGCQLGAKRSTLRTYLQDAHQRGARIVVKAEVDQVTVENGAATGLEATVQTSDGKRVRLKVKAKAVVVSAGSLHTPALLMRSGLTNANIGRNLHLHPTSVTYGVYDAPVQGWSGVIMSRYIPQFNNLDGIGYGVTLETAPVHPGIAALAFSWSNGEQHKRIMQRLANLSNIIIITRDRGSGHIALDSHGQPILHYELSSYDKPHLMQGIVESLKIHRAAGAIEIGGPHTTSRVYVPAQDNVNFEDYLQSVQAAGLRKNTFALLSAHQMSSCRMGANPAYGALDPMGETFEVRNLFVADGSALPTATGVNPMLTIMGVSHMIAQHIKAKIK